MENNLNNTIKNSDQSSVNQPTGTAPVQPTAPAGPEPTQPTSNTSSLPAIDASKWSWGSFVNPTIGIIASRQYSYLFLFILYFIPFVNFLAIPILHIYFGLNGRRFLQEHKNAFASNTELAGFIRGYDRVGKVMAIIFMVTFAIGIIGILASVMLSGENPARNAGQDANVKANLSNLRVQGEVYYSTNEDNGYTGFCDSFEVTSNMAVAECDDSVEAYALSGDLEEGSYCVDSTGYAAKSDLSAIMSISGTQCL